MKTTYLISGSTFTIGFKLCQMCWKEYVRTLMTGSEFLCDLSILGGIEWDR